MAGKLAPPELLVNVPRLVTAYYTEIPDSAVLAQRVAFGTSGHRGSAFETSFNESHILAISQAVCDHRKRQRIDGPLFLGADTHALSAPAQASALEVLSANGVYVMLAHNDEYTPTPAVSHAILTFNRSRLTGLADGIVVTPSHNPPDGDVCLRDKFNDTAQASALIAVENALFGGHRRLSELTIPWCTYTDP